MLGDYEKDDQEIPASNDWIPKGASATYKPIEKE